MHLPQLASATSLKNASLSPIVGQHHPHPTTSPPPPTTATAGPLSNSCPDKHRVQRVAIPPDALGRLIFS